MERTTFLEHYRICVKHDGAPQELSRAGTVITYKAVDDRFGEPVALKLIPIASIDPAAREQLVEQARAAQKLDHINIGKIIAVGIEHEYVALVLEDLAGETAESWIIERGPMPADEVLRVGLQVVRALRAAAFHRLAHGAIQPSNVMIVPGQAPDGGWPFVKLLNFGLAGLERHSEGDEAAELAPAVAPQFASPEQVLNRPVDFRSEIYSLGATMCFLLTGAAPLAIGGTKLALRKRPLPELGRSPKPLRDLLAQMLHENPDQRPQDPAAFEDEILKCLMKVERRQAIHRRLGIPSPAVIPRKPKRLATPLAQVLGGVVVFAVLVLAAAVAGAFMFPDVIMPFWHQIVAKRTIGVPIGVPDASSSVPSQAPNAAAVATNQPMTSMSPALDNSNQNPSPDVQQAETSNAQVASAPTAANAASPNVDTSTQIASAAGVSGSALPPEASPGQSTAPENSAQGQDNSSAQANATPQPATDSQSSSPSKKKRVASTSKRARVAQDSFYGRSRLRRGSMRTQFVGITSDGRLILRLPSGRTAIVAPDSSEDEFGPRRHRRPFIERDEVFSPPRPFAPDGPPYD
jgi:serine/threonine protein kinase